MKQEFFDSAMRKKIYRNIEELQGDLALWLGYYDGERPHSGRYCYGKTPLGTFAASKHLSVEKHNELIYTEGRSGSVARTERRTA